MGSNLFLYMLLISTYNHFSPLQDELCAKRDKSPQENYTNQNLNKSGLAFIMPLPPAAASTHTVSVCV